MPEKITVHVVSYGRKHWYMRYADPVSGRSIARSTEVAIVGLKNTRPYNQSKKEAEKVAAKWEAELQEGRYKSPSKVSWEEFRNRYEDEVLASLADGTAGKVAATFNAVERHVNPCKLAALTAERVSHLQRKLREEGLAESTIKGHLAHLQAALRWAGRQGLLNVVPTVEMPKRAKGGKMMKGRPITGEEFDRMLAAVPKIVAAEPKVRTSKKPGKAPNLRLPLTEEQQRAKAERDAALTESWRHYLRGLWWSGLRLEESLELWWDRDDKLRIDLTGRYPMLRIPAPLEKGNQDRLLPLAPEFAELLMATPEAERTGRVFSLARQRGSGSLTPQHVSRIVTRIGKSAGVKVHEEPSKRKRSKGGASADAGTRVKYASAHDLRRAFGARWALRVMPPVLQQLMRHESIETTMRYYVGRNADATAEALYAAVASGQNVQPAGLGNGGATGTTGINTSGNSGMVDARETAEAIDGNS